MMQIREIIFSMVTGSEKINMPMIEISNVPNPDQVA
jgi:hypothetical protein